MAETSSAGLTDWATFAVQKTPRDDFRTAVGI